MDFLRCYKSKDKHHPLPPHPCSVAEKAVRNGSDGVIIPLGESGSGKSSNVQMILHYLTLRCHAQEQWSKDEILAVSWLSKCYDHWWVSVSVPGQFQSVPGQFQSVPGQSVPGQSLPGQSVPGQSVPGQLKVVSVRNVDTHSSKKISQFYSFFHQIQDCYI